MLRRWIRRHYSAIQALASLVLSVLVGTYTKLVTDYIMNTPAFTFHGLMADVGIGHMIAVFSIVTFVVQVYLSTMPVRAIREVKDDTIKGILAAACRSLIRTKRDLHIRAIVTIANARKGTRSTKYSYNVRPDPERTATFPIEFGVTGEAFRTRSAVARELAVDHRQTYPAEIAPLIHPDLRCVLALPLFDLGNPSGPLLGVLAFDSNELIKTMRFEDRETIDIAQSWADLISLLVAI